MRLETAEDCNHICLFQTGEFTACKITTWTLAIAERLLVGMLVAGSSSQLTLAGHFGADGWGEAQAGAQAGARHGALLGLLPVSVPANSSLASQ